MRRFLSLPITTLVLAALAFANDTRAPSADVPSRQFQRNREMIRGLVESSLMLSREDDPLKRAQYCNTVAQRFAAEMSQAARGGDEARAAEMGRHFHGLLRDGVAANLKAADQEIPIGSAREWELFSTRTRAMDLARDREDELQGYPMTSKDMQDALKAVKDGRAEVESTLKARQEAINRE